MFFAGSAKAQNLAEVEKLFDQGKMAECEQVLRELLKNGKILRPAEYTKAVAMREYIDGGDARKIEETVKMAREIAAHDNLLTADLLNHATLMIRRATDWKERGIPEYQELSDVTTKLLQKINDNGDAGIAIKVVLLRTRNYNLNGEFDEPVRMIIDTLRHFYPDCLKPVPPRQLPDGAIQLLILAGEQYVGAGVRTNMIKEKAANFSRAAQFYVQAFKGQKNGSEAWVDLSLRVWYCHEVLRLLGYDLRLPDNIGKKPAIDTIMIDNMLEQHRYHDVVMALENNRTPEMRVRYAAALIGIQQFDKAAAVISRLSPNKKQAAMLLPMARSCKAARKNAEALKILQLYAATVSDGNDIGAVYFDCANLLLAAGDYRQAAKYFLLSVGKNGQEQIKPAVMAAGQCYYRIGEHKQCVELLRSQPYDSEMAILLAQAALKCADKRLALNTLRKVLASPDLVRERRKNALLLTAMSAETLSPGDYVSSLKQFIEMCPDEPQTSDCILRLIAAAEKNNAQKELFMLGKWIAANRLPAPETPEQIIRIAKNLTEQKSSNELYEHLLKTSKISPAQLVSLCENMEFGPLKIEILRRYLPPFANTPEICELYYQLALLDCSSQNWNEALAHCELLLKQPQVYRYYDVKLLHADILKELGRQAEARVDYQELISAKLSSEQTTRVICLLSESWIAEGDYHKAMVTAWTAVPLDGYVKSPEETTQIRKVLEIIISCAEKIRSSTDKDDAIQILNLISKEPKKNREHVSDSK